MQRKEARHKLEGNRKGDNHNEKVVLQLVVVHLVVFLLVAVHLVVFHSVVIVEVKQYKELALVLVLWLV